MNIRAVLWVLVFIALAVAAPQYAIVMAFMWLVIWVINKLIALHDKYLL